MASPFRSWCHIGGLLDDAHRNLVVYVNWDFSATCMVAWLMLVPRDSWPSWTRRWMRLAATKSNARRFERSRFAIVGSSIVLGFTVLTNLLNMGPKALDSLGRDGIRSLGAATMMLQEFSMFGDPPHWSPHLIYEAKINSDTFDLFSGYKVDDLRNRSVYRLSKNQSWRRLHFNVMYLGDQWAPEPPVSLHNLKQRLLDYQLELWDRRSAGVDIPSAELRCERRPITIPQTRDSVADVQTWATYVAPN
ncbi:MAG: hypothetical protein R3C03_07725 [Pirellulaceae bacterium]